MEGPLVNITIPVFNRYDLTQKTLLALKKTAPKPVTGTAKPRTTPSTKDTTTNRKKWRNITPWPAPPLIV